MVKVTDTEHPYELDVKRKILESPQFFGNIGNHVVISEKAISDFSVIADLLVFSENYGIIGIEIKTEHDSTQRLNKQLRAYEAITTETWVVVHDSLYPHVEKVLKTNNHPHVGVISYTVFEGEIYMGKVIEPTISNTFMAEHVLNMMHKTELLSLARRVTATAYTKTGKNVVTGAYGDNREGRSSTVTGRFPKRMLIQIIIAKLGRLGAYQIVVDSFINHNLSLARNLKYYHFSKIPEEDGVKTHIINDAKKL